MFLTTLLFHFINNLIRTSLTSIAVSLHTHELVGGFLAAVRLQTPRKIRLLLCLAENAIGPSAVRNDDIIKQYSGKTVEINNSDAEGRLVLSDAVAHATKHYDDVGLVVDMATLTGAQLVATGKTHAGILANTIDLERRAVDGGLASGDLCFPLVYAPELLKKVSMLLLVYLDTA